MLNGATFPNRTAGVKESEKPPLENRIWYQYPLQWKGLTINPSQSTSTGGPDSAFTGSSDQPIVIRRRTPSNLPKITRLFYNEVGNVTRRINPLGQELKYDYSADGIDLFSIRRPTVPAGTQTINDTFPGPSLDSAWVPSLGTDGAINVQAGHLKVIAPSVANPDFWLQADTGSMVCREFSGTSTQVQLNTLGLNQFERVFMLRTSPSTKKPEAEAGTGLNEPLPVPFKNRP